MSAPERDEPRAEGRYSFVQDASADDAAVDDLLEQDLPEGGKPLPPPPPMGKRAAPPIIASSPIPTRIEQPLATEVDLPRGLGSDKETIVGMPVPNSAASAPILAPEPARQAPKATPLPLLMSDIATSDAEIPLTPSLVSRGLLLFAQWRREILIGSVAVLGLSTGFCVVRSLASPAAHVTEATAGSVERSPSAPTQSVPVAEPAAGSPSAAAVEESPSVAPTTAPSGEPVAARSGPSTKTSPAKPTASAKTSTSPARPPPPASTATGTCNPPYRLDFFGKRVPKPGC
jgi:hypothetical protein